jgi:hypothetical protein
MSAHLAGALKTHEPSYMPRAIKPFFIPVVHSLLSAVGHVAAPEPSLAGRQSLELQDTWWHRSPPRRGLELWDTWRHQSPP